MSEGFKTTSIKDTLPQHILVLIAELLEQSRSHLCTGGLIVCDPIHVEMVAHNICHCLSVCSRTGSTAPKGVMDLCQFVGDSIGDVCSGGRPTVCAQDHTILEVDGHTGGFVNSISSCSRGRTCSHRSS